jgi:hypothetical protein
MWSLHPLRLLYVFRLLHLNTVEGLPMASPTGKSSLAKTLRILRLGTPSYESPRQLRYLYVRTTLYDHKDAGRRLLPSSMIGVDN